MKTLLKRNFPIDTTVLRIVACLILFSSCKSGPVNLFKSASPHEQYERKLLNSGLHKSAMGLSWINEGKESLDKAVSVTLPYLERGYFASEQVSAATFSFRLTKGQELQARLTKIPAEGFMIYMDLWEQQENGALKLLASADTVGQMLKIEISKTTTYVLRLQPELLSSVSYTLELNYGPSLAYPLKTSSRNQIQSLFGDGRDANSRKHEGIDIFAPFRTPVLAIAEGTITRVNENNLGGKVVWLRPAGKDYTLYYAHLDEQIAREGQQVRVGDTIGLMGKTGNARTTAPHLHFGIYTSAGAVDPLPFVNRIVNRFSEVTVPVKALHSSMRMARAGVLKDPAITSKTVSLKAGTVVHINAASGNYYRVDLPDGSRGYLSEKQLSPIGKPIERYTIPGPETPVYSHPDVEAAIRQILEKGEVVAILGTFGDYKLVSAKEGETGWIR